MLSLFRHKGLSNIIYGVVIVATILVFVIQFNPSAGKKTASLGEQCVAKVNGWCITPKDHTAAYRILIPRGPEGEPQMKKAKSMHLATIALDGLVERELLIKEADRLGLTVTDNEITDSIYNGFIQVSVPSDSALTDTPALAYSLNVRDGRVYAGFRDPKTKRFELRVYERSIKGLMGRSPTEFREEQGREILAAKVREVVRAPVRVSEPEALESYIAEKSSATVNYISVKQSYVGRYAVQAAPKDVDEWMKEKANEALVDATVNPRKNDALPKDKHVRHILVKVAPTASAEDKALALGKLARAYQRIKAGETFATVAKDTSDDPGSAARGGDVGTETASFVAPFKKAADALKPGEMTNAAIETQFGYHLIARDDSTKSADVESAFKRDVARELYVKTKALGATKDLASKIASSVKAGKAPEDAIRDAITPFERAPTLLPPFPVVEDEEQKASQADAGSLAVDAAPGGDAGKGKNARRTATSTVTAKAATALTDPDRPALVVSRSFNQGGDPVPELSPEGTQLVTKFAFSAKDGEVMAEPVRAEDGFVVVALKEHKLATKEEFGKDSDTYLQTLVSQKQAEALTLYVRRLRVAAKDAIKIDDKYMADKMGAADGGAPLPAQDDEEEGQ